MKAITDTLFKALSKKHIMFLTGGYFVLINIFITDKLLKLFELGGMNLPDVTFGNKNDAILGTFTSYGEKGLIIYDSIILYDIFFPITYALFFGASLYLLWKNTKLHYIAWLPLITSVIDYSENYYILKFLSHFPNITDPSIGDTAGALISIKIVMLMSSVIFIVAGILRKYATKRN